MIILRDIASKTNPNGVWASEVRVRELTPARRDKMVNLLNLTGFTLRTDTDDIQIGEIRNLEEVYMIEDGV